MGELIYEEESYGVKGAVFEVYKMLHQSYRADIVCYDKIILELKAVSVLLPEHSAQLFNYLRATRIKLGFLVNFGHYPGVEVKRIAL